jgi:hypothetical protein
MVDVLLPAASSRFQLDLVKAGIGDQYQAELGWPTSSSLDYKDPGFYAMFFRQNTNFTGSQIVDRAGRNRAHSKRWRGRRDERARTLLRSGR